VMCDLGELGPGSRPHRDVRRLISAVSRGALRGPSDSHSEYRPCNRSTSASMAIVVAGDLMLSAEACAT
jgi:hypothetical protein